MSKEMAYLNIENGDSFEIVDAVAREQINNFKDYSTYDVLRGITSGVNRTHNGITFSWNNDYTVCTASGTASAVALSNMANFSTLPSDIVPGKTYYVSVDLTNSSFYMQIIEYSSGDVIHTNNIKGPCLLHLDPLTNGMVIRVAVSKSTVLSNDTVSNVSMVPVPDHMSYYMGTYPPIPYVGETTYDLNEYLSVGEWRIATSNAGSSLVHGPEGYSGTGVLKIFYTHTTDNIYQALFANENTDIWVRHIRSDLPRFDEWCHLTGASEQSEEDSTFLIHSPEDETEYMIDVFDRYLSRTITATSDWCASTDGLRNVTSFDIYSLWDALQAEYPDYIDQGETIGYSLNPDGTNYGPVKAYYIHPRLTTGTNASVSYGPIPTIYITAGNHGEEATPTWNLFSVFSKAFKTGNVYSKLLTGVKYRVIPCLDRWSYDHLKRSLAAAFNDDGTKKDSAIDPITGEVLEMYDSNRQCVCSDNNNPSYVSLNIRSFATEALALTTYMHVHNIGAVPGDSYIDLHNCSSSLGYLTSDSPTISRAYNLMMDELAKDWLSNTTWANGDPVDYYNTSTSNHSILQGKILARASVETSYAWFFEKVYNTYTSNIVETQQWDTTAGNPFAIAKSLDITYRWLRYVTSELTMLSGETERVTKTGSIIEINDAIDSVPPISLSSNSTIYSRNMYPINATTRTSNGVTFTPSIIDPNTVVVNGTASSNAYSYTTISTSNAAALVPAGTYYFKVFSSNPNVRQYINFIDSVSGTNTNAGDLAGIVRVKQFNNPTYVGVRVQIASGVVCTNDVVHLYFSQVPPYDYYSYREPNTKIMYNNSVVLTGSSSASVSYLRYLDAKETDDNILNEYYDEFKNLYWNSSSGLFEFAAARIASPLIYVSDDIKLHVNDGYQYWIGYTENGAIVRNSGWITSDTFVHKGQSIYIVLCKSTNTAHLGPNESRNITGIVFKPDATDIRNYDAYGTYEFSTECEEVIDRVLQNRNSNTVTFGIITDAHLYDKYNPLKCVEIFNKVCEKCCDFEINLGDSINGYGATRQENLNYLLEYNRVQNNTSLPVLYTIGHHEMYGASMQSDSSSYMNDSTGIPYDTVVGMCGSNKYFNTTKSDNHGNWYYDLDNVRIIGLDSVHNTTTGFNQETITFLTSAANTQKKIVVFAHVPANANVNWKNKAVQNSSQIESLLNSANVMAYFHGHTHWDNIVTVSGNDYPYISTCCALPVEMDVTENGCTLGSPEAYPRTIGTISEFCFDIVNVHTDTGAINLFRFGAGYDRAYISN